MATTDDRDPEICEVLDEIARRLAVVEQIRGPEQDEKLEAVERYAAPHALTLFYEIRRLDSERERGVAVLPRPDLWLTHVTID